MSLVLLLHWAVPADAAPGDIDAGFGNSGRLGVLSATSEVVASADGGSVHLFDGPNGGLTLIKRVQNGARDDEFGLNGSVSIANDANGLISKDLLLDSEGRILLSAIARFGSLQRELRIYRLSPSGDLDASWDGDGVFVSERSDSLSPSLDIAVDSEDRVLYSVSGTGNYGRVVRRLAESGLPDGSFSGDGEVEFASTVTSEAFLLSEFLSVGPNDSVYVGGDYGPSALPGSEVGIIVEKFSPDGSPDPSFGEPEYGEAGPGIFIGGSGSSVRGMTVDPLGRVVFSLGGMHRLTVSGGPDESFAPTQDVITRSSLRPSVDPQGRILFSFVRLVPAKGFNETSGVGRLNPDGSWDRTFGERGRTYVYRRASGTFMPSLAIGEDGSILLAGDVVTRLVDESGPGDLDGDGFADRRDECELLPSAASHGCPRIPSFIDAKRSRSSVTGRLQSESPACQRGRTVELLQADGHERLGRDRTDKSGSWEIPLAGSSRGVLIARAKASDQMPAGVCVAAKVQVAK